MWLKLWGGCERNINTTIENALRGLGEFLTLNGLHHIHTHQHVSRIAGSTCCLGTWDKHYFTTQKLSFLISEIERGSQSCGLAGRIT